MPESEYEYDEDRIADRASMQGIFNSLRSIHEKLNLLIKNQNTMATTLQNIQDDVTGETSLIASLSTLVNGLEAQVNAIPGITPAQQAQIDSIFNTAESNKAALTAALVAGTPAAAVSTTANG